MTGTPPAPPDYSGIVERALDATNFGQLQVAAYQTVNAMYASAETPAAAIAWLMTNAGDKPTIDATLQKFLCLIVVDPALLPLNGVLQQATLDQLSAVLVTLLTNYVAAAAKAKGA